MCLLLIRTTKCLAVSYCPSPWYCSRTPRDSPMSRNFVSRALVLTLSTSIVSFATAAPAHDRVLVPIYLAEPVAGANGSRWKTDFAMYNRGPASAHLLWC